MIAVDRIESDRAVLVINGETVEVPTAVLPSGAGEGTVLALVAAPDQQTTAKQQAADRLARLQQRDTLPEEIDL